MTDKFVGDYAGATLDKVLGVTAGGVVALEALTDFAVPSGGSDGDVLTKVTGAPAWAAPSGGASSIGLGNDPATTTGLNYGYEAGKINGGEGFGPLTVLAGTIALPDNSLVQVYYDSLAQAVQFVDAGAVTARQSKFLMATVTTSGGSVTLIEDLRAVCQAPSNSLAYSSVDFGQNPLATSGLNYGYNLGRAVTPTGNISAGPGSVLLDDNSNNFIECDSLGSVASNTVGFTLGRFPMAFVITSGGAITTVIDVRTFISIPGEAAGSFTTVDGKTVTVSAGIITSIV